jgi:endonuclease YncB( thermonuclease family)
MATAKPEPDPKPKPDPNPKPDPEPKPKPRPQPPPGRERSAYDATVTVSRVVDGDTVEISPAVNGVEDVRLIGVDTPETVDPGEEVEPYGRKASSFATGELSGRKVELEFDEERIDQYGRLLAYLYTGQNRMFNEVLVAKATPRPTRTPPTPPTRSASSRPRGRPRRATPGSGASL